MKAKLNYAYSTIIKARMVHWNSMIQTYHQKKRWMY